MRILSWLCCKFGRHDMGLAERRFDTNGREYRKLKCLVCGKVSYQIAAKQLIDYWHSYAVPPVFRKSPLRCHTGEHIKDECPGDHGK